MKNDLTAKAAVTIDSSPNDVWKALTDPKKIKQYMFDADVMSDWEIGGPIRWKGLYNGKRYEDKGVIRKFEPHRLLQFTHFSPLSGKADVPENYHNVTIELAGQGEKTRVTVTQDNNDNENARAHSEQNWETVLNGLKSVVEQSS